MIEAFGEIKSESAWSRDWRAVDAGITRSCLKKRVAGGWDFETALTTPLKSSNGTAGKTRKLYEAFGEEKSLSAWSRDPRCKHLSRKGLQERLNKGSNLEDALS